jgi:hypothetical protein
MHLLTEQALLALGVPHPMIKTPPPANPTAARFYIDLLTVLKAKTEGARTDAESRQLDEILYELRMRVMDLKPAADAPAAARP